ncbi:MAG: hypothetical protein RLZZ232_1407 [Planctomycetota bacterium]|jgi:hypothetical protein
MRKGRLFARFFLGGILESAGQVHERCIRRNGGILFGRRVMVLRQDPAGCSDGLRLFNNPTAETNLLCAKHE